MSEMTETRNEKALALQNKLKEKLTPYEMALINKVIEDVRKVVEPYGSVIPTFALTLLANEMNNKMDEQIKLMRDQDV